MTPVHRVVRASIECSELPPAEWGGHSEIWIGVQSGKEVVQRVKLPAESALFEIELKVANDNSEPHPNFVGPFAQGKPQDRFLYVCWGRPGFGGWIGFRRAKLPLAGLTWKSIESNVVRGRLKCTDPKGAPICATVKGEHFSWLPPTD